jgi:hypothetical protein
LLEVEPDKILAASAVDRIRLACERHHRPQDGTPSVRWNCHAFAWLLLNGRGLQPDRTRGLDLLRENCVDRWSADSCVLALQHGSLPLRLDELVAKAVEHHCTNSADCQRLVPLLVRQCLSGHGASCGYLADDDVPSEFISALPAAISACRQKRPQTETNPERVASMMTVKVGTPRVRWRVQGNPRLAISAKPTHVLCLEVGSVRKHFQVYTNGVPSGVHERSVEQLEQASIRRLSTGAVIASIELQSTVDRRPVLDDWLESAVPGAVKVAPERLTVIGGVQWDYSQFGAVIASVQAGSNAESAGLRTGDIISAVDGRDVLRHADLFVHLATKAPGDAVALEVERDGATMVVSVVLVPR